ncbi:MAG: hypothetical protein OHK0053_27590 [Microscillaceae bacterium]
MHPDLLWLYEKWQNSPSEKTVSALAQAKNLRVNETQVRIEALAAQEGTTLLKELQAIGLSDGVVFKKMVSGWLPYARIPDLQNLPSLRRVSPVQKPVLRSGSVSSQGDVAMQTDLARLLYGVDGTGIKIGVLSDSYNNLGGAANGVASGDLPNDVQVLKDLASGGSDEGRAMMEIIHDVAPGADLVFRTAFDGPVDFAAGILALQAAGCQVIVDDVGYLTEPFFQDGVIAQAVDEVAALGVAYFSSAGNNGTQSYESSNVQIIEDLALDALLTLGSYDFHNFGGGDARQSLSIPAGASVRISVQWAEPFFSVTEDENISAATDFDIYLLNQGNNAVLAQSVDFNVVFSGGSGDAVELLEFENTTGSTTQADLVIARFEGEVPSRIKYIVFGDDISINEFNTNSSTLFGHPNAEGAAGVGAAFWGDTPPFGTDPALINSYSSRGGTPILFDLAGNSINIVRPKPEFTGPDGGDNTFFGEQIDDGNSFPNFFGTSAAAPHVAALAALMLELAGGPDALSPAQILNILTDTAEDMETAGFDNASGAGFVNAELALEAVSDLVPANRLAVNINGVPRLGQLFSAQVSLQNNEGQLVNASSNTAIRLVLETGNGTLSGTLTGLIVAGTNSVILNGLEYSQAESNVVIRAIRESGDMVLPGNSSAFTVLPRASLTFVSVNGGLNPELNEPFSVEVQVRDANGAPVNATRSTTLTLARVNGSGTLSGTLSLPLAVGANSLIFSGLTYSQVENGLSLSATASNGDSFNATTSTLITVTNLPVLLSNGSLQIQPNPHNGHFWVLVEGNLRAMPLALGVRDGQGRLVYSQKSEQAAGRHEVNLQQLPAGSYILEMELGSEKIARRMIKY